MPTAAAHGRSSTRH